MDAPADNICWGCDKPKARCICDIPFERDDEPEGSDDD